jgi:hypothetical protein
VTSDQIFKVFLQEFLPRFLELFLPNQAALLDFDTITYLDKELFTDFPQGETREADFLAEIRTKDGQPEILLIHIEVQGKRSPEFSARMWEYYNLLRQRFGKRVYPIVIYLTSGAGGITTEEYREELLGEEILTFRYRVVGLADLPADEWADRAGAVSASLATLMASPRGQRGRRAFDSLKTVWTSDLPDAQKQVLSEIVDRLGRSRLTQREHVIYEDLLASEEAQEIKEMVTTFEERAMEKGLARGMQQGMSEGIRVQREMIVELLTERFEQVPVVVQERINNTGTLEELKTLFRRALHAATPEDVLQ